MFDNFLRHYSADAAYPENTSATDFSDHGEEFTTFLRHIGGQSFNRGLYRTVGLDELDLWSDRVFEMFPSFAQRAVIFGYDWLGRAFGLLTSEVHESNGRVLLFEPGTAEVLEIPADLVDFHNDILLNLANAALASTAFESWIAAYGQPLTREQCVGYQIPLFLGGVDGPENFEVSDIAVYWSLFAQIVDGLRQRR